MDNIQEKYSNIIVDFLKNHEAISVNFIETKLTIPTGTISRGLNGHKLIPKKYIYPLLCTLADYGLIIDDYSLSYDSSDDTLLLTKIGEQIASYEVITDKEGNEHTFEISDDYENKMQGPSYFFYTHKVDKILYTDYFDLH